jgi:hypothetical protein
MQENDTGVCAYRRIGIDLDNTFLLNYPGTEIVDNMEQRAKSNMLYPYDVQKMYLKDRYVNSALVEHIKDIEGEILLYVITGMWEKIMNMPCVKQRIGKLLYYFFPEERIHTIGIFPSPTSFVCEETIAKHKFDTCVKQFVHEYYEDQDRLIVTIKRLSVSNDFPIKLFKVKDYKITKV